MVEYLSDRMQPEDWLQVSAIYQSGINTGNATFETNIPKWEIWDAAHLKHCRLVLRNGEKIAGWAELQAVSQRPCYTGVAEVSIYLDLSRQGQGLGRKLLQALIVCSEENGIWTLQAGMFPENIASVYIHRQCGFREISFRQRIGKLHGVWRDVLLMERRSGQTGI